MQDEAFITDLLTELKRAREKFPSSNLSFAALVEEVGELAQAMLKWRAGLIDAKEIWKEGIQVAAMTMRVVIEGDPSFTSVEYKEPSNAREQR